MHAGTIVTRHYLAQARTVARSFLARNPGARFTALVVGERDGTEDGEKFEVLHEDQLGLTGLEQRRRRYDDFEYSVSFKPTLLKRLLELDPLAVYLDADLYVLASFAGLEERFGQAGVLLTPHLLRTLPDDGLVPAMPTIMRAGAFNSGFVAVRRGPEAAAFLDWWEARLVKECRADPDRGVFVDQKWLDLAPGILPGIGILREPGWNTGFWSLLAEDELEREGDRWRLGGDPVRAFHFSGFDPANPRRVSRNQNRLQVSARSPLAELCEAYAAELKASGYDELTGGRSRYHGRSLHSAMLPLMRRVALARARMRPR